MVYVWYTHVFCVCFMSLSALLSAVCCCVYCFKTCRSIKTLIFSEHTLYSPVQRPMIFFALHTLSVRRTTYCLFFTPRFKGVGHRPHSYMRKNEAKKKTI